MYTCGKSEYASGTVLLKSDVDDNIVSYLGIKSVLA